MSKLLDDKTYCESLAETLGIRVECDAYENDTVWVVSNAFAMEDCLGEGDSEPDAWAKARRELLRRAVAARKQGRRVAAFLARRPAK